jgi:hypothetical protein
MVPEHVSVKHVSLLRAGNEGCGQAYTPKPPMRDSKRKHAPVTELGSQRRQVC